jgi:hypothetical protein
VGDVCEQPALTTIRLTVTTGNRTGDLEASRR